MPLETLQTEEGLQSVLVLSGPTGSRPSCVQEVETLPSGLAEPPASQARPTEAAHYPQRPAAELLENGSAGEARAARSYWRPTWLSSLLLRVSPAPRPQMVQVVSQERHWAWAPQGLPFHPDCL